MLKLRFQLGDFMELPKRLSRFAALLEDWGPFFRYRFIPAYLEDVNRNFDMEGKLVGGWAPLSPEYAAWKRRMYPGHRMLERELRLRRSLSTGSLTFPEMRVEIFRRQAFVGTDVPYAPYVNAKRRFMLRWQELSRTKYQKLMADWVRQLIQEGKLG